ncbi:MAG: tRNA lysidine(34) synthetase TilS [Chloroflexi bacterium]|nr:tRNA lysidine(34) synthetase TilS [Chloroflexota bacterium]
MSTKVLQQVEAALRPYLPPPTPLIVGFSGGADSLTLLHVLRELLGPDRLVAAHLNHGLRPEADIDMYFVAKTAASWHIPIVLQKIDVTALAVQQSWSIEEAGRKARYRFLSEVALEENCRFVAVGHHADDQAETVLLHLLRGSGLAGLRGMQPAAPLPGMSDVTLLRPLLSTTRADIEAYCTGHHLTPVKDESNKDTTFFRNRIRHELLPMLTQYDAQIKTHLQQLAAITAADYDVLEAGFATVWTSILAAEGDGWLKLARADWGKLPLSYRRLALRQALLAVRPSLTDIGFRPIELARRLIERNSAGEQMDLPGGLVLQVGYQEIVIAESEVNLPSPTVPQMLDETVLRLPIPGRLTLANGWELTAKIVEKDTAVVIQNDNPWQAFVDVKECDYLLVRPRLPGERFQPLGMHGRSTKLKKVMVNRKMARGLRPLWPIVATEDHLVWLVGQQQDECTCVTAVSKRIVHLICHQPSFPFSRLR